MSRDRIIALYDHVPASVTIPTKLGALRASDSPTTWQQDAVTAILCDERPVLSGDIRSFQEIARDVRKLKTDHTTARFGLLLHWTQALEVSPDVEHLRLFENVYVAIDLAISQSETMQIRGQWWAQWVFVPTSGLCWSDWIPKVLLPQRRGRLLMLATPSMSVDELRLQIAEFSFEHPLIEFVPAPQEWFVPSEIGPWGAIDRDPAQTRLVADRRADQTSTPVKPIDLSIVVPFLWTGGAADSERLRTCLKSIVETTKGRTGEIIVSVDREMTAPAFLLEDIRLDIPNLVVIENARRSQQADWRAGFIRNCGLSFARGSILLFVDSDVVLTSVFSQWLRTWRFDSDVIQISDGSMKPGFEAASSSLIGFRKTALDTLGAFAEAFNHYGCEDNLLVWKAQKANLRIEVLPRESIEHRREHADSDDLAVKMERLGPSAKLMYRATLDPRVHAHFYSSLGGDVWIRAALKRLASMTLTRWMLAPLIFMMTVFEAENRLGYLRGFYDVFIWKLKRPVLWIRSQAWADLRGLYRRGRAVITKELWFFKDPTAWFELRTPTFYRVIWRPLLKTRYFLEYHLLRRWRRS